MTQTQELWVIEQLQENGYVTRNQALRNNISRLAARIADLKEAGWQIVGRIEKKGKSRDYRYTLVEMP